LEEELKEEIGRSERKNDRGEEDRSEDWSD
jgi:hypothetical protein